MLCYHLNIRVIWLFFFNCIFVLIYNVLLRLFVLCFCVVTTAEFRANV